MRLFAPDLVLLHPPSVYDFRRSRSLFGPVSDAVFSSPVFEMYPLGLTSIAARVEREGYNVRLVNLAHRMLEDPGYDVEAAIASMRPLVFGIDLHWLLHAHGALEIARLVKRIHPDVPVLLGGLSASYYDRELVGRPEVDWVLRGDSTEEAVVVLMEAVAFGGPLADVPGLTWTDAADRVRRNPVAPPPESLAGIALPDYGWVVRSVLRSGFHPGRIADVVPYSGWRRYPMTGVLTSRGCFGDCVFCGGGRSAYRRTCDRERPAFRSAEDLVDDVSTIASFGRTPIMLLNDLRLGGGARARHFFERMAARPAPNEIVYELFSPADEEFFAGAAAASRRFSVQISLESHVEETRRRVGKFACSDERIEETVRAALRAGAGRVDLFFMVGLPGQTRPEAVAVADWARTLVGRLEADGNAGVGDVGRLRFFATPLSPFLDPGSPAFEDPASKGYRLRFRTLEEHRRAMTAPTWKEILNYETDAMSRDEIVAATYECYDRMAELDRDRGLLSEARYREALANTRAAREILRRVDVARALPEGPEREASLTGIQRDIGDLKQQVAHTKEEMEWPVARRLAPLHRLGARVAREAGREAWRLFTRRIPLWLRWRRSTGPGRPRATRDPASNQRAGSPLQRERAHRYPPRKESLSVMIRRRRHRPGLARSTVLLAILGGLLLAGRAPAQDPEAYVSNRIDALLGRDYEHKMISSGPNFPPFDLRKEHRGDLILLLHEGIPRTSIRERFGWSEPETERRLEELASAGLLHRRQDGRYLPTVMVMTLGDVARSMPVPGSLVDETERLVVRHLPDVRRRYAEIEGFRDVPFDAASLLVLSDVLLDNWQIRTVEDRFLGADRPLRGESRYYYSIQEKAPFDSTEAFGIYGNQYRGYGRVTVGIYGNRRTGNSLDFIDLDADRIESLFGTRPDSVRAFQETILKRVAETDAGDPIPPDLAAGLEALGWMDGARLVVPRLDAVDQDALSRLADSFADDLVALLERHRAAITRVYEASPYVHEVTFEEYFIWWYHLYYSAVTDRLVAKGLVTPPAAGITTYLLTNEG